MSLPGCSARCTRAYGSSAWRPHPPGVSRTGSTRPGKPPPTPRCVPGRCVPYRTVWVTAQGGHEGSRRRLLCVGQVDRQVYRGVLAELVGYQPERLPAKGTGQTGPLAVAEMFATKDINDSRVGVR